MKLLRGIGRKLSIPVLVVSLLGWLLFVIAFAVINNRTTFYSDYRTVGINVTNEDGLTVLRRDTSMPEHRASLDWFPHWCFLIDGPFVFICMFLHLLLGRWFTGVFTHFLIVLYLVCGGGVIYLWALRLFSEGREGYMDYFNLKNEDGWLTEQYWGLWPLLEWVGCLSSVSFLTLFIMMWPCFHTKKRGKGAAPDDEEYYGGEEEQYEEYEEDQYEQEEGEMEEMEEEEKEGEEPPPESPTE